MTRIINKKHSGLKIQLRPLWYAHTRVCVLHIFTVPAALQKKTVTNLQLIPTGTVNYTKAFSWTECGQLNFIFQCTDLCLKLPILLMTWKISMSGFCRYRTPSLGTSQPSFPLCSLKSRGFWDSVTLKPKHSRTKEQEGPTKNVRTPGSIFLAQRSLTSVIALAALKLFMHIRKALLQSGQRQPEQLEQGRNFLVVEK